jgi:glutamate-1-semialdehyde aminotransferase
MGYEKSLELFREQLRLIPGGSQTNAKRPSAFAFGAYPIFVSRAKGCRVEDIDGNTYIDFVHGCGPIVLGYRYPAVDRAVRRQLRKGIIGGLLYPVETETARLLCEMVPCAEMVRFLKGGGEATAAAVRIARACTGREVIVSHGYRGWPDVWAAATNNRGVPACLSPLTVSYPFNDLAAAEKIMDEHAGRVAALFISVLGEAPAEGYLQALCDLAHRHGALFVMDEVITGFRLAPGGAQEYFGVTPDLACFAKAMANGMPVSAVAGKAEHMEVLADLAVTVTYGGEALSLAAAAATMREIRDKNVPEYLWHIGRRFMDRLEKAAEESGIPFRCSGLAPVNHMQFLEVEGEERTLVWLYFLQEMAARGVLFRRGSMNAMTFSHREKDVEETAEKAAEVFRMLKGLWKTPGLARRVRAKKDYA